MQDFSPTVARDFMGMFLGDLLGEGMSRKVYEHKFDPTLVIKIEEDAGRFQNIMEARIWEEVSYSDYAKWFAPVIGISPCGMVLVMKKVAVPYDKDFPTSIPTFFGDLKKSNYGMLNGKFVCVDYGCHIVTNGLSKRMKKVKWDD